MHSTTLTTPAYVLIDWSVGIFTYLLFNELFYLLTFSLEIEVLKRALLVNEVSVQSQTHEFVLYVDTVISQTSDYVFLANYISWWPRTLLRLLFPILDTLTLRQGIRQPCSAPWLNWVGGSNGLMKAHLRPSVIGLTPLLVGPSLMMKELALAQCASGAAGLSMILNLPLGMFCSNSWTDALLSYSGQRCCVTSTGLYITVSKRDILYIDIF